MYLPNKLQTLVAVLLLGSMTACIAPEEKVINRLNNLSAWIEKEGHTFNASDWEETFNEMAVIHEEMSECEFTGQQLKEIGRVNGRLTALITKEGAKTLSEEITHFLKGWAGFVNGFLEGAKESFDKTDQDAFIKLEENLSDAFENLEKKLEEMEEGLEKEPEE